jgi:phosphomannomutase
LTSEDGFRAEVEAWIAEDPDADDRAELRALLDRAGAGAGASAGPGAEAAAEVRDRFADRLRFGTAGLRGAVAAGPNRMNRAVVRAATAAVAGWLLGADPGGAGHGAARHGTAGDGAGVVVGCDARHRSADFADEAARVLAGAGIVVHMLPRPCPTPLLAFAVRQLGAAAGVMITASHNPAADNGYKLYLSDGAQVIPPADAEIEQRMAALGPLSRVPVADETSPLIVRHSDEVAQAYLDAVVGAAAGPAGAASGRAGATEGEGRWSGLNVVYTPMHGVAGELMLRAIRQAGFTPPHVVAAQAEPDPDFPTVAFPNPEEPAALDLALADARRLGAELVLASDPDGDRLAVAVPEPAAGPEGVTGPEWAGGREGAGGPEGAAGREEVVGRAGGWRVLTGDQVGALLGASLLERTAAEAAPRERLVASTIVSSTLLAKIAAAAGARYAETLTGFKWIARAADGWPGTRFVFGYEEALGYAVGGVVRDKDGIGAALAMLWLAASAKAAGRTVLEVYDALETAHGVHLTSQLTLRTAKPGQIMSRLRGDAPAEFGDEGVTGVLDLVGGGGAPGTGGPALPAADVLIFRLAGARVVLRPSGTEPKIKCYIEIVEPLAGRPLAAARDAAAIRLAPVRAALQAVLADG